MEVSNLKSSKCRIRKCLFPVIRVAQWHVSHLDELAVDGERGGGRLGAGPARAGAHPHQLLEGGDSVHSIWFITADAK